MKRLSLRDYSMAGALAMMVGFFAVASPAFLSARNLSMLAIELSITGVMALGMLLVILPGQIDLSVGSGVGLLGGVASVLVFEKGWPAPLSMLAATAGALVIWRLMGKVIVEQKVPAFIMTLGGLLVFKGLHWLVIHNATIPIVVGGGTNAYSLLTTYYLPPAVGYVLAALIAAFAAKGELAARRRRRQLGLPEGDGELAFARTFILLQLLVLFAAITGAYRGVPLPALILGVIAFAVHVLTQHTPFGRHLYAIGGNEEAAFVSGIPVQRVVVGAYTLMGAVVALTGFLQTAYSGASTSTVGGLMELDAVAACVIGGASLRGGRGTVPGVIFGALLMATVLNGMTLMAVSPEIKFIARGAVLTLAVWMDVRLARVKDGASP